ncbi:histidinol-phosphate transaminase [Corynebacterium pseudodiphtheriticum]|uniref:histidinol-phosphate transaminase n=1 Tax=Corynebacterium pseudodiphtheriticum TaxID=37637 RepID=UPI002540CB28|nr:histidinol-phosphate transaminase [Corynebacterium pseudodiphtheriticum]MDK4322554.1 histidinol-phosphate transaminase [Corynebacterium pseudodiphtheriticum]
MLREDLESLPAYVPGKRMPDAVKLSSNESAHPPLPSITEAIAESAAQSHRYPDMGVVELRKKLAAHLGLADETSVTVGTGSSALCQQLVTITCQPGDEVIFPWRSFEAYPIFTQVTGATAVPVPLRELRNDLPAMADAITERTRLIFVCNPNNPTGTTITDQEFREFMDRVPADVVVALDEAYVEYNTADNTPLATEAVQQYPNVIGLRTFSKAYGLAGVRVGYAFGNPDIIATLGKVAIPFGVSAVAQAAALAALEPAATDELNERVTETNQQRDRLADELGLTRSFANFVWIPTESLHDSPQEVAAQLAESGVLVRAFDAGLRITATTAEETDALLAAWKKVRA